MIEHGFRLVDAAGECEIDLVRRELRVRGSAVPVGARAFEVIEALAQSPGELVTKDELMDRIWPGAVVTENTLQVHALAIRKALGPFRNLLKTVSGRGYRLLGDWTVRRNDAVPPPHRTWGDGEAPGTNFPATVTHLVGRTAAVARLRDLMSAYRTVTLTGPGGIGKTSLALNVAHEIAGEFGDGGGFVELASLSDPALVPAAVVRSLALKLDGQQFSADAIARTIGNQRVLIVLDNCEHVIGAAANLAEALLRSCPHATILATSREILRIEGEFAYRVPPLEVPSSHQEASSGILEHSAVQLFVTRMRSLGEDAPADGNNLPMIAAICRRLDGIPLAIEFAAARAATLGIQHVAGSLDDRFALLAASRRTALPRHQTLRATLDWSYELLPETERRLLRRLAVFPTGFTLEAAIAVADDAENAAVHLSNLVEKSLVTQELETGGSRWRLLETIRAYALEKLGDGEEAAQAARAHAAFYRDLIVSTEPLVPSDPMLSLYLREIDNVRAALDWSFSAAGDTAIGIALTGAYVPVWLHSALLIECCERTECALGRFDPAMRLSERLRMQLHIGFGLAAALLGTAPTQQTRTILAIALRSAESLNDMDAQLRALWGLWMLHYFSGKSHAALSFAERLSAVASRIGEPFALILGDRLIGNVLHNQGDQHRAQAYLERVIERSATPAARRISWYPQVDQCVYARTYLSRVLLLRGYLDQAAEQARLSLEEAIATGYENNICQALRFAVCPIALTIGDLSMAEQSIARLSDIANSFNAPFTREAARCLEATLLIKRGAFEAGSTLLRSELDACERSGWTNWYTEFLGDFAEGLAGLGRFSEALAAIEQALAKAEQRGERYYVAELLRLKGEFLLAQSDGEHIADCFNAALTIARDQDTLLFELRAAMALARWRLRQDLREDAQQILAPAYGRFVEGFGASDLRAAKALLATLDGPPG